MIYVIFLGDSYGRSILSTLSVRACKMHSCAQVHPFRFLALVVGFFLGGSGKQGEAEGLLSLVFFLGEGRGVFFFAGGGLNFVFCLFFWGVGVLEERKTRERFCDK